MKKIVIKIGRSIVTTRENILDMYRMETVVKQVKILQNHRVQVIIVISGAVTCGRKVFESVDDMECNKSLLGGIGQAYITSHLFRLFEKHKIVIAQLLLTQNEFEDHKKKNNLKTILLQAMEQNIVVIVNENDMVDLHSFQGNDNLACEIAKLIQAHELLLMTDVDGVYDQHMQIIKVFTQGMKMATVIKQTDKGEVGGMKAKIQAAFTARKAGINSWIVHGKTKNILTRLIIQEEHIGTRLY